MSGKPCINSEYSHDEGGFPDGVTYEVWYCPDHGTHYVEGLLGI